MLVRFVVCVCFAALGFAPRAASAEPPSNGATPARPTATAPAPADDIDAWLAKLTGTDPAVRKGTLGAIDATSATLPHIAKRLSDLDKSASRDAMAQVLARLGKGTPGAPSDSLERLVALGGSGDPAWRDLVSILGMSRALARIGTMPAARELTAVFARFGDVVRPSVERELKAMGERSVAALIEVRRGEARPLRAWAAKILDALGKTLPGEAVQTSDNQVLADVLRAYGRTKDVDAARVIVSFANSDRNQVRDAAREAVAMLGENGIWQLRESYENLVGKKAPEEWGWEKLANELFAAYDRSRLSEVYALMDEGLLAYKGGKLDAMAIAFDRVLARAPSFERRREMVPGYVDFARSVEKADRPRAEGALRRAVRIDPSGPRAREVESKLAYLEAQDLAAKGVVDETAYRRALDLDPGNVEAKAALAQFATTSESSSGAIARYALGAVLAIAAIAFALLAVLWRGKAKEAPNSRA